MNLRESLLIESFKLKDRSMNLSLIYIYINYIIKNIQRKRFLFLFKGMLLKYKYIYIIKKFVLLFKILNKKKYESFYLCVYINEK